MELLNKKIKDFLKDIKDQHGIRFGEPWKIDNKPTIIMPLLSIFPKQREYALFSEKQNKPSFIRIGEKSNASLILPNNEVKIPEIQENSKLKKIAGEIKNSLKKIPCLENQIGIFIRNKQGVTHLECFDNPDSWKAFHESVEFSSEKIDELDEIISIEQLNIGITEFIRKIQNFKSNECYNTASGTTFELTADGIIGEYTIFDGKIIHLILKNETLN